MVRVGLQLATDGMPELDRRFGAARSHEWLCLWQTRTANGKEKVFFYSESLLRDVGNG